MDTLIWMIYQNYIWIIFWKRGVKDMIHGNACRFKSSAFIWIRKESSAAVQRKSYFSTSFPQIFKPKATRSESPIWLYLLLNKHGNMKFLRNLLNCDKLVVEPADSFSNPSNHYGFHHRISSSAQDASQSIHLRSWC